MHGPAPGAPRGVHDRRDGLPVGAAVVRCSSCCRRCCSRVHTLARARVFRRAVPAVPASGREWRPEWALSARRRARACCCSCPRSSRAAARRGRAGARATAARGARGRASLVEMRAVRAAGADPHAVPHALRRDRADRAALYVELAAARRRARRRGAHALRRHGLQTLIGVAWAAFVYWLESAVPAVAAAGRRRADRCRSRCRSTRAASRRAGARAAPGCS